MLQMKGVCGFYVGYEEHTWERRVVSRAWFRELAEPWRNGSGIRIRFGTHAIQVGRYKKSVDENPSPLSQLGGRELTHSAEEIGAWRGPHTTPPRQESES